MAEVPRFGRRSFLFAVGLGAGAVMAGCRTGNRSEGTTPPGREGQGVLALSFAVESRFRLLHLVAPGFVQAEVASAGVLSGLARAATSPQAPFAAVEAEVVDLRGGAVLLGLASPDGERLVARYDPVAFEVAVELHSGGTTSVLARAKARLEGRFRLAFVLCENQVTVLAGDGPETGGAPGASDTSVGWRALLTERAAVAERADLRDPATLARYTYGWGAADPSRPVRLGAVRAGLFGMAGIRDPHLVEHSDGRPFVRDGKVFLTATCAGLGFFQQAHWGVFTLDLADPTRWEQVAQLYASRDGMLLGDHAGQVVRDDENDRWIVVNSSWGDFAADGVHVRGLTTDQDLLSGVHLLETERLSVPTSAGSWDPGLTKIDGRWHLAFVESPSQDPFDFHPALAVAGGPAWDEDLELVGAADDLHHCEGPILTRVGGTWSLLASDGEKRVYPVFDLRMRRLGQLDAPYGTNIPHPQIVALPGGGHLLVTFDGTRLPGKVLGYGTHGDVVVMRAR